MNEQRSEAYLKLIQQLFASTNGEEIGKVLSANSELVDRELLLLMTQVAEMFLEDGNQNAVNFLRSFHSRLMDILEIYEVPASTNPLPVSDCLRFLMKVLRAIRYDRDNSKVIYPLLEANLDKLDENFILILQKWAEAKFSEVAPSAAEDIAIDIVYFSNRLREFASGDKTTNIEIAIAGYKISLVVLTCDNDPDNWAVVLNNLGAAYQQRIIGDKSENLEMAIAACKQALQAGISEAFPTDWAAAQNNLGGAYQRRILGDRAENLEMAIVAFQSALQIYTKEAFPIKWAETQNNLGNVYSDRICGDKAENLEIAIASYEKALQIRTFEAFPIDWANIQHNLGWLYLQRISGNKAQNLEMAIAACKKALQVKTFAELPNQWAATQNNLGAAYSDRICGDKAKNLEMAIAALKKALQVKTFEKSPIEWASVQSNLSAVYHKRISGDRAKNLEMAIVAGKRALEIYNKDKFPIDWARTQNNLSGAYKDRILGDRAENLEMAIAACKQALEIYTKDAFPTDWAATQNNLGAIYFHRILGDRAENLEMAIAACQQALEVRNFDLFPIDWARTQNNLGLAYWSRISGDRAENLEMAIDAYHKTLQVRTSEALPIEWAETQNNLGLAYCDRIRGDKVENLEMAIDAYQKALQVHTFKALPIDWAMTQSNLGLAYLNRSSGNRTKNLEMAIDAFQKALKVRTPEAFPIDSAETQNNLGIAYSTRISGDRSENLEMAIDAYQKALQVRTQKALPIYWAQTQDNLGSAYSCRISGDRSENLEMAIAAYQKALQVRTQKALPTDWAITQNNLGVAYWNRISGDRAKNLEMAIAAYQKALQVYTPKTHPLNCLNTARNLGYLYFKQSNWQDAIKAYKKAIKSVELSRSWATTDDRRQQILTEAIDVYANIIQCFVNLQQYDKAVKYADRSRSRLLVELMASKDLYPDAETPPEVEEYLQLQRQLDRLRHPPESDGIGEWSRSAYHRDDAGKLQEQKIQKIEELERRLQELWRQIRKRDPVLAGQLQVDPLTIEQIQQLIENEQTAILNFYTTNEDTYIFILRQKSTTLHTCQGQGIETLQLWMRQNWLIPYVENRGKRRDNKWCQNIGPFLSELAQRLQLPQLIDEHLADIEELVIVPHLFLHQIPFAALPIANSIPTADSDKADGSLRLLLPQEDSSPHVPPEPKPKPAPKPKPTYLSDKYRLRVIPSCQILSYCHENQNKKKIPPSPKMGIVENATNDLPFSGYECQNIATTYGVPETLHLRGDRATPTNYRHLAQQVQLLHSSHHAKADLNDPLNSKLDLCGGEVTLGEIFTWRLPNLEEVFLACCETNFNPKTTPADDILVIAAGWLSAGALNVVSTLWAVDDCATAVFSIFYYQQRHQQPPLKPSEALREAQRQLRNLTGEEFNVEYRAPLEAHLRKIGKNDDLKEYCDRQYPFESPRYWAAFVSQGMN